MPKNRTSSIAGKAKLAPLYTRFKAYAYDQLDVTVWEGLLSRLADSGSPRDAKGSLSRRVKLSPIECLDIVFQVFQTESNRDFFVFKRMPKGYENNSITSYWNFFFVTANEDFVLMDGHWKHSDNNSQPQPQLTIFVNDGIEEQVKQEIQKEITVFLKKMDLGDFADHLTNIGRDSLFKGIALDATLVLYTCLKRHFNEDGPLFSPGPMDSDVWQDEKRKAEAAFGHIELILASFDFPDKADTKTSISCELCEQWVLMPRFLGDQDGDEDGDSTRSFQCKYAGVQCRSVAMIGLSNNMRTADLLHEKELLREKDRKQAMTLNKTKAENANLRKKIDSLQVQLDQAEKRLSELNTKPKAIERPRKKPTEELRTVKAYALNLRQLHHHHKLKVASLEEALNTATKYAFQAQGVLLRQGELAAAMLSLTNPSGSSNLIAAMNNALDRNILTQTQRAAMDVYWRRPVLSTFAQWYETRPAMPSTGVSRKRARDDNDHSETACLEIADNTRETQTEAEANTDESEALEETQDECDPNTSVVEADLIRFRPDTEIEGDVLLCFKCGRSILGQNHKLPKAHFESNLEFRTPQNSNNLYHKKLVDHVKAKGCKVWAGCANTYHKGDWQPEDYAFWVLGRTFFKHEEGYSLTLEDAASQAKVRKIIDNRFARVWIDLKPSNPHARVFPRRKKGKDKEVTESRVEGSPIYSKKVKETFLEKCKEVLMKYKPRFERVPSSKRLSASFTKRGFINDLNMAMAFYSSTDSFLSLALNEAYDDLQDDDLQDDRARTGNDSSSSPTIDKNRAPDKARMAYYIDGQWCCAAGELCQRKGNTEVLETSHTCASCSLKVHSLICTKPRGEDDPYCCKRCDQLNILGN